MKLEVGKEYLYKGNRVKLVYVGKRGDCNLLVVCQLPEWAKEEWVSEGELKELPPTAGSNGEYVHRSYLYYFKDGMSGWQSGGEAISCDSVRKLTPEEQEEYDKCK